MDASSRHPSCHHPLPLSCWNPRGPPLSAQLSTDGFTRYVLAKITRFIVNVTSSAAFSPYTCSAAENITVLHTSTWIPHAPYRTSLLGIRVLRRRVTLTVQQPCDPRHILPRFCGLGRCVYVAHSTCSRPLPSASLSLTSFIRVRLSLHPLTILRVQVLLQ